MECSEYTPMLSRFLDEDLTSAEVERLLQHISSCATCQRELDSLRKLRGCFHVLREVEVVPWPGYGFLERAMARLEQEEQVLEEDATRIYSRFPSRRDLRSRRERIMAWLHPEKLFPVWVTPFRYVAPVLIILLLGLWLISDKNKETVDVASIKPSRDLSPPLGQSHLSFDSYVFHHTTLQPMETLGDELPLIYQAVSSGTVKQSE
jgi:Putative zinc-finger